MPNRSADPAVDGYPGRCPHCGFDLDLLAAPWCGCTAGHPSKICPTCWMCACSHFDYGNPLCWEAAPDLLKSHGFDRLFTPYIWGRAIRRRPLQGS